MLNYFFKRISISLLIVWCILTATFFIMRLAPGDPASIYIQPEIDPQVVEKIRSQMGLDQPVIKQYFLWISEFVRGNFGVSFTHHRQVSNLFLEAIPNTLQLTVTVFIIQAVVGIWIGIFLARRRNTKTDTVVSGFLLFLYSVPGFWLALMAILVFSLHLNWLPSSQMHSLIVPQEFGAMLVDRLKHLILPAAILSIPLITTTARFVRDNLETILNQSYIRTAVAYGLPSNTIFYKYALKNALLPLMTMAGLYLPFILGGAVIIEYIFAWPGMGRITIEAIFAHDYPVILASNFIAALAVVFGNFFADVLYVWVDPRIKFPAAI